MESRFPAKSESAYPRGAAVTSAAREVRLEFAALYDTWFEHVTRWLRALGATDADAEDLAQDVFLVVRRRLIDFDGRNVAGWLYRISCGQVRQHQRRRWVQRVLSLRAPIEVEDIADVCAHPDTSFETKEKRRLLDRIVSKMSEKRRVAFMLF